MPKRTSHSGGSGSALAGGRRPAEGGDPMVFVKPRAWLQAAQRLGFDPKGLGVDSGTRCPWGAGRLQAPTQGCTKIPAWEKEEHILHCLLEGAGVHSLRDQAWPPGRGAGWGCFLHLPSPCPRLLAAPATHWRNREKTWSSAYRMIFQISFCICHTNIQRIPASCIYIK